MNVSILLLIKWNSTYPQKSVKRMLDTAVCGTTAPVNNRKTKLRHKSLLYQALAWENILIFWQQLTFRKLQIKIVSLEWSFYFDLISRWVRNQKSRQGHCKVYRVAYQRILYTSNEVYKFRAKKSFWIQSNLCTTTNLGT